MDVAIDAFMKGFPDFMLYGAVTLAMIIAGVVIHVLMTPMKEMKLIREGNTAAGIGLAGVIFGLALPMAACLASATSIWDVLIWGVVAILLQLIAFRVADLLLRDLPKRIERNEVGAAVVLVAVKVAAAMITSAALWDPNLARI
jgi:putative membrane protein